MVSTDLISDAGQYRITAKAIDILNGLESRQTTLTLTVIDPCANQALRVKATEEFLQLDLVLATRIQTTFEVMKRLKECPLELELDLRCDKCEVAGVNFSF